MPPKNYYGLPPAWNPGFEIPDYVMAEPPGRGVFTTAWLPRGTISGLVPEFSAVDVGREITGRDDAGLGSLGDDTLGAGVGNARTHPIAGYGQKAASYLMHSIRSVPAAQRQAALRAVLDAIDPALWGQIERRAKEFRAAGGTPQQALTDALAISLSAGMLGDLVAAGKRRARGDRRVPKTGHMAMGAAPAAVERAQVYALEALGFSWSSINPLNVVTTAIKGAPKAASAAGGQVKEAATATAHFVVNGVKTLGALACKAVNTPAGTAASGSTPYPAAGLEFCREDLFALRAGYTGRLDIGQGWSVGGSFKLIHNGFSWYSYSEYASSMPDVEVDYAFVPMAVLGDTHRIGLVMRFGRDKGSEREFPARTRSKRNREKDASEVLYFYQAL